MRHAPGRLENLETGETLATRVLLACTFLSRLRGLQFRPPLAPGEGLVLVPGGSIHSMFVRGRFDAVFLDGGARVVGVERGVRPWRALVRAPRGTRAVVELASAGGTRTGHRLGLTAGPRGLPKSVSSLLSPGSTP